MHEDLVAIIQSTYDGQKYPAEQLDSLLAQDDVDVALLIMGDRARGSDLSILRGFASHHENVQRIACDNRLGVARSFPIALQHAESSTELPRILPIRTTSEIPASIANSVEALNAERDSDRPALLPVGPKFGHLDRVGARLFDAGVMVLSRGIGVRPSGR
ncbi:hypothetical protein FVF58_37500 [Paraburkholderia panacisoli]|uniref:Uncharacterized protein n=1 Tax=Paraburkholderia panacisoli TaxID=2603818 RepID=A0A5B0GGY3_9BURK|nr:hypothetical protein [Paraburkholderia panacisoli]KAA1002606.1 hypothetical protein FVF58_37500 [Paraburkholderia panacisoli]